MRSHKKNQLHITKKWCIMILDGPPGTGTRKKEQMPTLKVDLFVNPELEIRRMADALLRKLPVGSETTNDSRSYNLAIQVYTVTFAGPREELEIIAAAAHVEPHEIED
jgi:hypothetical protein